MTGPRTFSIVNGPHHFGANLVLGYAVSMCFPLRRTLSPSEYGFAGSSMEFATVQCSTGLGYRGSGRRRARDTRKEVTATTVE